MEPEEVGDVMSDNGLTSRLAQSSSYRALGGRTLRSRFTISTRRGSLVLAGASLALVGVFGSAIAYRWGSISRLRGAASGSAVDEMEERQFCGKTVEDIEFHTRASIYWVGNILNEANCCAECDAHPECLAWTFGKKQGVEGLSNHCYLKKLEDGEQPQKVKRPGVVSGLLLHKLQKHGIVADMLAAKSHDSQHKEKERLIRPNETCAGPLNLTGHGRVSVVSAKYLVLGVRAGLVDVPYSNWAVIPHLGGRAFFASSCKPGEYDYSEYVALRLLGGKLRYTADVSRVGCGCNAQFHLVPMSQNMDKSECEDYSCGHGRQSECGAVCAEIAIQDANQYAWSSSIHAHDDDGGLSGGYGGGADTVGRRNWTDAQYGPGGECIDTTWPFEVEVSFPVDKSGNLQSVDVTLTQEDHHCPLKLSLKGYRHGGKDSMKELSEVLRAGVTPSISYYNRGDLRWLDGSGSDARGPCVKEVPEACPSTVRFYDFKVESDAKALKAADESNKPDTPMVTAIETLHKVVAAKERKEEVAKALGEKGVGVEEPCVNDCHIQGAGEDQKKKLDPDANHFSYVEKETGNSEWEVLAEETSVWSSNASKTHTIRDISKGEVVTGKRFGVWVKLAHEPGYVLIERGGEAVLKERVVAYAKIVQGSCADAGMFPIQNLLICETAAFALGYFDTSVKVYNGEESRPEGCHLLGGQLWVAVGDGNVGNGVINGGQPICVDKDYPTTIITTTTTRTATTLTTTTITTTSTTTWGWPSLFCIEVARAHGYELPLVKEQQRRRASIFSCDEYSVFTDGGEPQVIGIGPDDGLEIKTHVIPPIKEAIGNLGVAGTTTNSWLNTQTFLQVWDLAKKDGRMLNHDWVVKVDPDAVFFPARLRHRMAAHTQQNSKLFIMNCNRFGAALYGSIEVFSKAALAAYLSGSKRCRTSLPWHGWGEDFFMSHCMDMLGIGRLYDFELLSDKRCVYRPCWDKSRVAFHDYKDASPNGAWFKCFNESGGAWNPAG